MEVRSKTALRNKARIEVRNSKGEVKTYYAYNLILDQAWPRMTAGFLVLPTAYQPIPTAYADNRGFGLVVHLGTGTATPQGTDTQLTSPSAVTGTQYARTSSAVDGTCSYTIRAYWDEAAGNGKTYTEIGLGGSGTATSLNTRALIEDGDGNPTSIVKNATCTITVYYTVYAALVTPDYGGKVDFVHGGSANQQDNKVIHFFSNAITAVIGSAGMMYGNLFLVGTNSAAITKTTDGCVLTPLSTEKTPVWTTGTGPPRCICTVPTYTTATHAGKIYEFGARTAYNISVSPYTARAEIIRAVLPIPAVLESVEVTNEAVGTGDGSNPTFTLDWQPIIADSQVVSVDGTPQTEGVDYTIVDATGVITFEAGHIPGVGALVTAVYDVEFIPKDSTRTIDISFAVVFGPGLTASGITPDTGVNTGSVNITDLAGTGFADPAIVVLRKSGETPIVASAVVVVDETLITCTFDLTGVAVGNWTVEVGTDDGKAYLIDGFTVTAP